MVATLWYTANGGAIAIFILLICVKTNYVVIYYLKDKSTRSFVDALKYVDGLVRVRKGYGVSTMYSDFLAAHFDTNDWKIFKMIFASNSKRHHRTCTVLMAMPRYTCVCWKSTRTLACCRLLAHLWATTALPTLSTSGGFPWSNPSWRTTASPWQLLHTLTASKYFTRTRKVSVRPRYNRL